MLEQYNGGGQTKVARKIVSQTGIYRHHARDMCEHTGHPHMNCKHTPANTASLLFVKVSSQTPNSIFCTKATMHRNRSSAPSGSIVSRKTKHTRLSLRTTETRKERFSSPYQDGCQRDSPTSSALERQGISVLYPNTFSASLHAMLVAQAQILPWKRCPHQC